MGNDIQTAAPHNGTYPADMLVKYESNKIYTSTDRKYVFPIVCADAGSASATEGEGVPPQTMMQLMEVAVKRHGNRIAMRREDLTQLAPPDMKNKSCPPAVPLANWSSFTWTQYRDACRAVGKGLIAAGVERYDGVNIFGFNSPEWFIGELGAMYCGAIAAGIYPSDTPEQVTFKSRHSNSSAAIVEGLKQVELFASIVDDLPDLKVVVCWDPAFDGHELVKTGITRKDGSKVQVMTWAGLLASGQDASDDELDARVAAIEPGNVCAYIYTSGTTGQPKAVMMTHDNIIFEARSCNLALPIFGEGGEERILSYLPLSHVAGMLVDIIFPIIVTAYRKGWMSSNFARPYDLKIGTIVQRLCEVKPTMFLGVPRVWEKISEKMQAVGAAIAAAGGLKPKISAWAKGKALGHSKNCCLGGNGSKPWGHWLSMKLLNAVKVKLGMTEMKFAMTGAAPIKKETLEYFGSLGIKINEVYGMSECAGACTISTDVAHIWGSCGYPMPGVEVKIFKPADASSNAGENKEGDSNGGLVECPRAKDINSATEEEQGEICFRGRNNMAGYMANPTMGEEHVKKIEKKNADAIDSQGWLHSGDKGCMGVHGFVKITGRYKELIIGAGGENIAPVPIEDNIKNLCPAISNIIMIGDKRKYNTALITLKAGGTGELPGTTDLEGPAQQFDCATLFDAMQNEEYIGMITQAIVDTNKSDACPSNASKIQKFTILPLDLSVQTGELTATLKTKRSVVAKMNADVIERMYVDGIPRTQSFIPYTDTLPTGGAEAKSTADKANETQEAATTVTEQ